MPTSGRARGSWSGEIGIDLGIAGDVERGAAGWIGEGEAALAVVEWP